MFLDTARLLKKGYPVYINGKSLTFEGLYTSTEGLLIDCEYAYMKLTDYDSVYTYNFKTKTLTKESEIY